MASGAISTTTVDGSISLLSAVHADIIQTHILTQLDGPALAATACTSSYFHSLTGHENLWRGICTATWPSVKDPRVQTLVSMFPSGHRSLFSDSFPVLDLRPPSKHSTLDSLPSSPTSELISAVDIFHENTLIFSKVEETETVTGWFQFPPFRIDLLGEKEQAPTPIPFLGESEILLKQLEEKLCLSWIIIDSSGRTAVNLSSQWPVSVEQHWLTRDVHVKYAVVLAGDRRRGFFSTAAAEESVECDVKVTLQGGGKEGGEMMYMYVTEVSMQMKDMEGRNLNGRESLVILQKAIANGGKRKRGKREEGKHKYEEFLRRKTEKKDRKLRVERVLNMGCLSGFIAFCSFLVFKGLISTMLFFFQRP